ncbi:hypothetical protein [Yinghuangia soli]|uniref:Uncharacterized protein n=1 Tax=Yinghuangia soli TaxID=2908204 RepID=A0AA41Q5M1_9ACTN|nr:hypothetical protein [Yinghuangia soli]MCF2530814.1 hypothetical protein [Yinghuangia soli]
MLTIRQITDAATALAAFRLADPALLPELLQRLRPGALTALANARTLPDAVVDVVVAGGGSGPEIGIGGPETEVRGSGGLEAMLALAANPHNSTGTLTALARRGIPALAVPLFTAPAPHADHQRIRAAVLAAADPADPRWHTGPDALVPWLLARTDADHLVPALHGPFPDAAAYALRILAPDLPPASPVPPAPVALPASPVPVMPLVPAPYPSTALLLLGLRHTDGQGDGDYARTCVDALAAQHAGIDIHTDTDIDWDLVRAEHAHKPLTGTGLAALAAHPACPPDLREAVLADAPPRMYALVPDLPLDVFGSDLEQAGGDALTALTGGLAAGTLDATRVLRELRPAYLLFMLLPDPRTAAPALHDALACLAARLGDDPAAWTGLLHGSADYSGTGAAMVDSALAHAHAHTSSERGPADTAPRPIREPASGPDFSELPFHTLYEAASPEVRLALVPALDPRAAQVALLGADTALRARILSVHGRTADLALATVRNLPAPDIARLLDLDDPHVNAHLYACADHLTHPQRVRILSGTDRSGHPRTVPLAPGLLDSLTRSGSSPGSPAAYPHLAACLDAGHPDVLRIVLRRADLHTEHARLHALIRLWENGGAHGSRDVRELLDHLDELDEHAAASTRHPVPAAAAASRLLSPAARHTARHALHLTGLTETAEAPSTDAPPIPEGSAAGTAAAETGIGPDADAAADTAHAADAAGLDHLRTIDGYARHPARLASALSRADFPADVLDGWHTLPWDDLDPADPAIGPLPVRALTALAEHRDRPGTFARRALRTKAAADPDGHPAAWLVHALDTGALTLGDVAATCPDASLALRLATEEAAARGPAMLRDPHTRRLIRLVRDCLDTADAWTVAAHLVHDFTGPLTELLATARAAAAPPS